MVIQKQLLKVVMLLLAVFSATIVEAQDGIVIKGKITSNSNGTPPIDYATVSLPAFNIAVTSDSRGSYELKNAPKGKVRIVVRYLGKQDIDTLVNVKKSMTLNFTMKDEDFHLTEVVVTAQHNAAGKATSSYISRNAIDHMQATS
ncbi:MAG: carboxypeptidase-like regulatory domain-containing protein, partial [Prevotella sp.]|nr:carboxypeptidase-like regulatory domain-containing protein [Prevotella sp.]